MDIERMHKWEHQHDDLGVVGPRGARPRRSWWYGAWRSGEPSRKARSEPRWWDAPRCQGKRASRHPRIAGRTKGHGWGSPCTGIR